ncbi:MAG: rhodanese family protein [Maricaulaceae bacterium]|nr:rhodanese family protein [Maricaulaceae bacterium]
MTALNTITPQRAAEMLKDGGVLVDIRAADEHARERIPGARHHPLDTLQQGAAGTGARYVIFHCRSGARTLSNASRLAEGAACEAFILEGGLEAWKKAGLPVAADRKQPLELMRQVQIVAGSLVLLGAALGALVNPWFFALSAFVGAGLTFAGISGWCGMATLLRHMPWNAALRA